MNLPHDRLQALTADIFHAAGCQPEEAERIARHLVEANLVGHDSHGVIRVPSYIQWLSAAVSHEATFALWRGPPESPTFAASPITGSFYEALVVKSKLSFLFLVTRSAHLPRFPVEASILALSSLPALFLYCDLLGEPSRRRVFDWRLRWAGRRLAAAIAGDYLLFVSAFRPKHPSLFSLTGDPSKPGTGTTHLFSGGAYAPTRNLRPIARTSPRRDETVVSP